MVVEGLWADIDDYCLIDTLCSFDGACMEDVDWDNFLKHKEGQICWKWWNKMVKHIGENGNKSFFKQVEVLSKRYCTDAIQAREEYDSK